MREDGEGARVGVKGEGGTDERNAALRYARLQQYNQHLGYAVPRLHGEYVDYFYFCSLFARPSLCPASSLVD